MNKGLLLAGCMPLKTNYGDCCLFEKRILPLKSSSAEFFSCSSAKAILLLIPIRKADGRTELFFSLPEQKGSQASLLKRSLDLTLDIAKCEHCCEDEV